MAHIEIIIKDDNGNIINEKESFQYNLDTKQGLFDDIEGAVDDFKKSISNEITQFLLEHSQKKFIEEKKL
jgi:hypothetical protein